MTDIFSLAIKADTTDIDKGGKSLDKFADNAERTESRVKKLRDGVNIAGKAIVAFGVAGVAALGGIAIAAGNVALELQKLARLSGVTVGEFQRLAFGASAFGIDVDKLADAFKDVQDRVGDFLITGAGPMADFFEKVAPLVGVTKDQFRGLSGKDALQLYVDTLEKANVSQSQMVFFLEAMSGDLTDLLPLLENGGKEFERLGKRADELGLILDEIDIENLVAMDRVLGELKATSDATANIIGVTLAPFVTDLAKEFLNASTDGDKLREVMLGVIGFAVGVAGVFANAARVFVIFGTAVGVVAAAVVIEFDSLDKRIALFGKKFELFILEQNKSVVDFIANNKSLEDSFIDLAGGFLSFLGLGPEAGFLSAAEAAKETEESVIKLRKEITLLESADESESGARAKVFKEQWQGVLDLLEKTLPSDQFNEWFKQIKKGQELLRGLKKEGEDVADPKTPKALAKTWTDSLGATGKAVNNLSTIFGENAAAAKALNKVSQVIAIVEAAISLNKIALGTTEAAAHVANESTKQGANALTAISGAFAAPFPINFIAGAAMIGIMQALGLFGGGGGGAVDPTGDIQAGQGTGTLLGSDEKTQSILNSQQRFEDIAIDQLAELRGIRNAVNSLTLGIERLAGSIVGAGGLGDFGGQLGTTGGALFGLFTKTSKKVIDDGIVFISQSLGDIIEGGIVQAQRFFTVETKKSSFFGLFKSSKTKDEFESIDDAILAQMAEIFGFIGNAVLLSAKSLGFETVKIFRTTFDGFFSGAFDGFARTFTRSVEQVEVTLEEALAEFRVDIGKVSFEGLSGEEIEAELQAIFSKQADLIAAFLVPGLEAFQKIGEGLFETLLRVTREQAIFNDAIDQLGISLSDLAPIIQIEIAQSIINLIGSVERFQSLTQEFFSEFFTEAEQFEQLSKSLTEAVEGLGLTMFTSREGFRNMIEGIDLTTAAGQLLFASLLELVPFMDDFFDSLENTAAEEAAALERELEEARRAEAEAARDAADAERELQREREATTRALEDAVKSAFRALTGAIAAEQNALKDQLRDDLSDIQSVFDGHRRVIEDNLAVQTASFQRQLDVVNNQVSSLIGLSDLLGNAVSQVVGLGRAQARALIRDAILAARAGQRLSAFELQDPVSALANIQPGEFGSLLELQLEQARTANVLGELKELTDGQLSEAEQNARLLEQQIETIKVIAAREIEALNALQIIEEEAAQARFDEEIALLDDQLETARLQLDALLGIDTGVLTLIEATAAFESALTAALLDQTRAIVGAIVEVADIPGIPAPPGITPPVGDDKTRPIISPPPDPTGMPDVDGPLVMTAPPPPPPSDIPVAAPSPQVPINQKVKATNGAFSSEDKLQAIVISSARAARILERWEGEGQPEVRSVA